MGTCKIVRHTHLRVATIMGNASTRPNDWKYGLCDCYQAPGFCLLTCFCPCISFASVSVRAKMSDCCEGLPLCLQWIIYIIVFFIPFGSNVLLAVSRACVAKRYEI